MTSSREPMGHIVRLQVQVDHLKQGSPRVYDPAPIRRVVTLSLDEGGTAGINARGHRLVDVHHRDHPKSRHRGDNGVSIGFTENYAAMRQRFGGHLVDGIAGESVLIAGGPHGGQSLGDALVVETADGPVYIDAIAVAEPCVEFSRFCLGEDGESVRDALAFLGDGVRGFYATYSPGRSTGRKLSIGDPVYRAGGE